MCSHRFVLQPSAVVRLVSLSREEQAQPLNFPRLLNGFRLGSSWLEERHGGRWRPSGCAGMLDDARGGLNGEWY